MVGSAAMKTSYFAFDLPRALIAQRPIEPRDRARLLQVGPGDSGPDDSGLADRLVSDLPDLLRPGELLVTNDTKVIPARLAGRRGSAGVELTLHHAIDGGTWKAFARDRKSTRLNSSHSCAPRMPSSPCKKQLLHQLNPDQRTTNAIRPPRQPYYAQ